eukprot:TRINITY_DN4479_c0_g1_i2.p1 TRINITY_DN4479_c0_g1~~TRINITY_DN4479_c0_g1_i2.p1  ORF type:complete len:149 (-),score=31.87 TRINITY_DN4479_c0_g1_i2:280-726(-)
MAGVLDEKAKFLDRLAGQEDDQLDANGKAIKKDDWNEKKVDFECKICNLKEKCHYYGKKPKFVKNLVEFKDDTYVLLDPFTPREQKSGSMFLILGGECAHCRVSVCTDCSLFYYRRYCVNCCEYYSNEFPEEIRARISKLVKELKEKG